MGSTSVFKPLGFSISVFDSSLKSVLHSHVSSLRQSNESRYGHVLRHLPIGDWPLLNEALVSYRLWVRVDR